MPSGHSGPPARRGLLLAVAAWLTLGPPGVHAIQPNILILMGDDIGYADYQETDPAMRTPALTELGRRGLHLTQAYTLQVCTPTRSALLTGRYPYRYGLQIGKLQGISLRWLDERQVLLPSSLRTLNYATHAVGKWHLGFCHWRLTPRYRSFDTFYGFYSGAQGYFSHSGPSNQSYDFRDNGRVVWENRGKYSTELHTQRVIQILRKSAQSRSRKPFFIYMAYQNAHAPFEADQRYVDEYFSHVRHEKRRTHCAMVAAMDESIGNITRTLDNLGLTNDTIIVYLSDNGGPLGKDSYNWPLRGGKGSLWEGGLRSRTLFVYPRGLSPGLVGTEWGGGAVPRGGLVPHPPGCRWGLHEIDGIDQFSSLLTGAESRRKQVVLNIDPTHNRSAVRIGNLKLLTGQPAFSLKVSGWMASPDMEKSGTAFTTPSPPVPYNKLYDILKDPAETTNMYEAYKNDLKTRGKVLQLEGLLAEESPKVLPFPDPVPKAPEGNPRFYSRTWSPGWCCF
ncbi:hypothetical protein ACOMHN_060087 [Nucella lapillus]